MEFDGMGHRLEMTAYAGTTSVTTEYVFDYDRTLTATSGSDTTFYLYRVGGVIGELTDEWTYGLQDVSNTQRQLTDELGQVTLASCYTPWGDIISVQGDGSFTFGYFGSMMDAATGLLYIGNGQYYDPETGRFINGGNQMNNLPVMMDPAGMFLAPLSLLPLMFGGKKKKKRTKLELLLILMVVSASLGMSLTTLNGIDEPPIITPVSSPAIPVGTTSTPEPATVTQGTPPPPEVPVDQPQLTCSQELLIASIRLVRDLQKTYADSGAFSAGFIGQYINDMTWGKLEGHLLTGDNENDAYWAGRQAARILSTITASISLATGIAAAVVGFGGIGPTAGITIGSGGTASLITVPALLVEAGLVVVGVGAAGSAVMSLAYIKGNPLGEYEPKRVYESTKKHDPVKGWGDPMDLPDDIAQQVLNNGTPTKDGRQIWSYYNGKVYRFHNHHGNIWHGYNSTGHTAPPVDIMRHWRSDGIITPAYYNIMRKW